MAYSTGAYNGVNDALDKVRIFLLAQGWSVDDFSDDASKYTGDTFTGKRLHVNKGGVYVSMRSSSNQSVSRMAVAYGYDIYNQITGISISGSSGYSASEIWDEQPDYSPSGAHVEGLGSEGIFYFFSHGDLISCVFSNVSTDYRWLVMGKDTSGRPVIGASGGWLSAGLSDINARDRDSCFLREGTSAKLGVSLLRSGSLWYTHKNYTAPYNEVCSLFYGYFSGSVDNFIYQYTTSCPGFAQKYIYNSPDQTRGNVILVPIEIMCRNSEENSDIYRASGNLEGMYWINMRNFYNAQEISIGADVYKLFACITGFNLGVAFLKS